MSETKRTEPLDLDAIEARANAATKGPWRHGHYLGGPGSVDRVDGRGARVAHVADCFCMKAGLDAEFIAHARADVPALVARVRDLEEALGFYANPESYHAVSFLFDPPGGGWREDFGDQTEHRHWRYERPMPGMVARAALRRGGGAAHGEDGEEELR